MRPPLPKLLIPLKIKDFAFLWSGMTISLLGDSVFVVAMAWEVYRLSNVPIALSYVGIAMSLPQVLLLVGGGLLTDHFERRRVMITADLLRAAAIGLTAALQIAGALRLWELVALVAISGVGTALFNPAFGAIVPELVPAQLLTEANALDQFVRPATRIIGPAIGGALVAAAGTGIAFGVDAASFLCSALALSLLRPRRRQRQRISVLADLRAGLAVVRSQSWLWGGLLAGIPMNLASATPFVLIPFIVKNDLHDSARALGAFYSVGAVGSLLTAFFVGQRGLPRRHVLVMYVGWATSFFAMAAYAAATAVWQLCVASFVAAAGTTAGQVIWGTMMHRLVPNELLGRVSSLDLLSAWSLFPLSFVFVGLIADRFGADATLYAAAAWGGAITLLFLVCVPGMRRTETDGSLHALSSPTASALE
jgi:MFS family permease